MLPPLFSLKNYRQLATLSLYVRSSWCPRVSAQTHAWHTMRHKAQRRQRRRRGRTSIRREDTEKETRLSEYKRGGDAQRQPAAPSLMRRDMQLHRRLEDKRAPASVSRMTKRKTPRHVSLHRYQAVSYSPSSRVPSSASTATRELFPASWAPRTATRISRAPWAPRLSADGAGRAPPLEGSGAVVGAF